MISVNICKVKQIFAFYPPHLLIVVNNNLFNALMCRINTFFRPKGHLTLSNIHIMSTAPLQLLPGHGIPGHAEVNLTRKDFLVYY